MTERAANLTPAERRDLIVKAVQERECVSVNALAKVLKISKETIRRDLTQLAAQNRIRKVHGGATLSDPRTGGLNVEGAFQARLAENTAAKRAIARRAFELFEPGDTLFIDTGTTTLYFAEELAAARGLTVMTNSSAIAGFASRGPSNTTYLIGGEYRGDSTENLGPAAIEQISRFHALHAVLSVGSIDANGVFDFDWKEADVARAMIAQSRSVTLLADTSKFGRGGLIKIAPLSAISRIVSDGKPPNEVGAALKNAQVKVIVA